MGFNIDKAYRFDKPTAWIDWDDGGRFLIAYAATDEQEAALTKLLRRRTILTSDEARIDITCDNIARNLLLDWENIVDDNGNPIEATYDNKYKALRRNKGFRDAIAREAGNVENFRSESEDLKNLKHGAKES